MTDEVGRGAWIADRLGTWGTVGGTVGTGWPAIARILHPAVMRRWGASGWMTRRMRWAEAAERFDGIVHPGVQWSTLTRTGIGMSTPLEDEGEIDPPRDGRLDVLGLQRIVRRVAAATSSTTVTAAFWDGYADWRPAGAATLVATDGAISAHEQQRLIAEDVTRRISALDPDVADAAARGPFLDLPHRRYFCLDADLVEFLEPDWPDRLIRGWTEPQTPNLLWSASQAWLLATEIDFDSTLVGGSRTIVDALLTDPELEVVEVTEDVGLGWHDDTVNAGRS